MIETWRWYGPQDPVSLNEIKQAGATGIVTALHHIYQGQAWPVEEVLKRKAEVEAAGFIWSVVESIPVHYSIKLRSGPYRQYIGWWKDSLAALAKAGISVVCYNFMPVTDWTRTELRWRLPSTGYALRFDAVDFAAYDLYILKRKGAEASYSPERIAAARVRHQAMSEDRQREIEQTIIGGLPATERCYDREGARRAIEEYDGMTSDDLRGNLIEFLKEVAPVAEENGIFLGIHADDPPISLFGLPRIVSTAADIRAILAAQETPANGITFCVGSLGVRSDNDVVAMAKEFAGRIHFAHLRQVKREPDGSFFEADHLGGSSDMAGVIRALLLEEKRRASEDPAARKIFLRPDHGHVLADDIHKKVNPGYSLIGRLKGLAEIRGVIHGMKYTDPALA